MMDPNSGETVSLQFRYDARGGGRGLPCFSLRITALRHQSEQLLNMMPELVRDDVGNRQPASPAPPFTGSETVLEIVEERRIEINLLIKRIIKRTRGAWDETAH